MKITEMLEREDFYGINQRTLEAFYGDDGTETTLYVYPKLNAIVTRHPSKEVVRYLLTEYAVANNVVKSIIARAYTWLCLKSWGLFASKRIIVNHSVSDAELIYPCNQKYRIFNFSKDEVCVILKDGFCDADLQHEIQFRSRYNLPDYIPRICFSEVDRYVEKIIHGKPLARISGDHERIIEEAYEKIIKFDIETQGEVDAISYSLQLAERIKRLVELEDCCENVDRITYVLRIILDKIKSMPIEIGFSHGDLQEGNIWIKDEGQAIVIIDWESWGIRSLLYDRAVLFGKLRPNGLKYFFASSCMSDVEKNIVLLEDIEYRIRAFYHLPRDSRATSVNEYLESIVSLY